MSILSSEIPVKSALSVKHISHSHSFQNIFQGIWGFQRELGDKDVSFSEGQRISLTGPYGDTELNIGTSAFMNQDNFIFIYIK